MAYDAAQLWATSGGLLDDEIWLMHDGLRF